VAWLGDSPVWVLRPDRSWRCLSEVKGAGAAVATSAVAALPKIPPGALPVRSTQVGADEVLLVMTDGIGDPLDSAAGEVARFLAEWWREPPDQLSFAAQVGLGRKSFDDDRTVVGIWPRPGGPG
jgi:Protein phosphatase 2C